MKKLISLALALMLVLSLSAVAMAAETTADMTEITITKNYEAANPDTVSPAEMFYFTIQPAGVTDAAEGVTKENMPLPTIGDVSYAAGDAGSENKSKQITVTLPEYSSVGIYTYTINETAGNTAGVTYFGSPIKLVVTVQQGADGKIRVAAVHTEAEGEAKSDNFANTYSAGSLAVSKEVTGNMGDQQKEFSVTVTFTAPAGKSVNEAISYTDGVDEKTIPASWVNGKAEAIITLKHGETVTFTNIPYGVTYTVEEADYTTEGYDKAAYTFGDDGKTIDSEKDTVKIVNNKSTEVDTGISLDSMPYILLIAVCAGAMVLFTIKHRRVED